jgi:hypothetical protein
MVSNQRKTFQRIGNNGKKIAKGFWGEDKGEVEGEGMSDSESDSEMQFRTNVFRWMDIISLLMDRTLFLRVFVWVCVRLLSVLINTHPIWIIQ